MAKTTIDEFFTPVGGDETLRRELEASPNEEAFFLTAVRRGAERGFIFTVDEVRKASREGQIELTEESLAGVTGGITNKDTGPGTTTTTRQTEYSFCTWTWLGC